MADYLQIAKEALQRYQARRDKPHHKWTVRNLARNEAASEASAYSQRGWIALFSEVLGEVILLVKDEEAAAKAPGGFVTYTEAEVALLLTADADTLRQIHQVKKAVCGRVADKRTDGGETE